MILRIEKEESQNQNGRRERMSREQRRRRLVKRKELCIAVVVVVAGHNALKCPNIGVPLFRPSKKKTTNAVDAQDSITLEFGEGPSQQTKE